MRSTQRFAQSSSQSLVEQKKIFIAAPIDLAYQALLVEMFWGQSSS